MTTSVIREVASPEVLRNEGITVKFYAVTAQTNKNTGEVTYVANTDMLIEKKVKYTNWTLHLIEDAFTTLAQYGQLLESRPFTTVIRAMSILLEWDEKQTAEAMLPYAIHDYVGVLMSAYYVALGNDPKDQMTVLNNFVNASKDKANEQETVAGETSSDASQNLASQTPSSVQTASSDGPTSGTAGFASDVIPTSSGNSALVSSSAS